MNETKYTIQSTRGQPAGPHGVVPEAMLALENFQKTVEKNGNTALITECKRLLEAKDAELATLTQRLQDAEHRLKARQHHEERNAPERTHSEFLNLFDVVNTKYEKTNFIIQDLLPRGLALLYGAPKIGKSSLAWSVALTIISDRGVFFNKYEPFRGRALYYALEDSEQRIQAQYEKQLSGMSLTEAECRRCTIVAWKAPSLGSGLEEEILAWIDKKECGPASLVIIDIFAKVRSALSTKAKSRGTYEDDLKSVESLQKIAVNNNIAIIIVHHSNKGEHPDFRNRASGSHGLTGGVDTLWALSKDTGSNLGKLEITGKDVVEQPCDLGLIFNSGGLWNECSDQDKELAKNAALVEKEKRLGDTSQRVLDFLRVRNTGVHLSEIVEEVGQKTRSVSVTLSRLHERGLVYNLEGAKGMWACTKLFQLEQGV